MFKTFSAALLAAVAVAKGTGDGSSRDNAMTLTLIADSKVTLTQNSYNSDNSGTDELHGDLTISSGTQKWFENIVYGFCIKVGTTGWDCMRVETLVNAAQITSDAIYAQNFTIFDMYSSSATVTAFSQMKKDDSVLFEGPSKNWTAVPSKSSKACTDAGSTLVLCSEVNCHYYRNFTTDSATQDRQLDIAEGSGETISTFGFFGDFRTNTFTTGGLVPAKIGAVKTSWKGVYPAYKAAKDANSSSGALSLASMAAAVATISMLF